MSKDFFPEIGEGNPTNGVKGSSQQLLLIVLLVLAVLFGYLYFFTGLIKPREQVTTASPVRTIPIKKPLPPRPGQGDEKQSPAAKPEEKQPAQAMTEKPAPPPAPTQAKPAAAPAQQPSAKADKTEVKPVRMEQAKTSPAPSVKHGQEAGIKPAGAATGAGKKMSEPAATARQTEKQGAYTLAVGEFATDRELQRARVKLGKLGIAQVDTQKIKKTEIMHRLFLAEFDNHKSADTELRKLSQLTKSAFILEENGRYAVYGGSYLYERGAVVEQKRLAGKGVKLSMKTANVMIQISKLTAGSFPSGADARKEAHRLKKQGVVAQVIKVGK